MKKQDVLVKLEAHVHYLKRLLSSLRLTAETAVKSILSTLLNIHKYTARINKIRTSLGLPIAVYNPSN